MNKKFKNRTVELEKLSRLVAKVCGISERRDITWDNCVFSLGLQYHVENLREEELSYIWHKIQ